MAENVGKFVHREGFRDGTKYIEVYYADAPRIVRCVSLYGKYEATDLHPKKVDELIASGEFVPYTE